MSDNGNHKDYPGMPDWLGVIILPAMGIWLTILIVGIPLIILKEAMKERPGLRAIADLFYLGCVGILGVLATLLIGGLLVTSQFFGAAMIAIYALVVGGFLYCLYWYLFLA